MKFLRSLAREKTERELAHVSKPSPDTIATPIDDEMLELLHQCQNGYRTCRQTLVMIEHLFAERQIPYTQPTPDLEKIAEECRAAVAAPCTGQDCINAILQALHSATAPLKEEIKELNEWKQGKKGIEEYYTVKYERDQLKEELERAATLLRENYGQISAAFIVKTEANKLKPEE